MRLARMRLPHAGFNPSAICGLSQSALDLSVTQEKKNAKAPRNPCVNVEGPCTFSGPDENRTNRPFAACIRSPAVIAPPGVPWSKNIKSPPTVVLSEMYTRPAQPSRKRCTQHDSCAGQNYRAAVCKAVGSVPTCPQPLRIACAIPVNSVPSFINSRDRKLRRFPCTQVLAVERNRFIPCTLGCVVPHFTVELP